jgi:hypothetical protein
MALGDIQRQLQTLYDVSLEHSVEDFLVTDRRFIEQLSGPATRREAPEKLFFTECDGELLVSLYLDQELVDDLENKNPYTRLDADNLNHFCTALEGVSHFVYLIYNATHERPVSQLELELQAEVDKFLAVWELCMNQGVSLDHGELSRWLFDCCSFDPALEPGERNRYEVANRLARAFCARIREMRNGNTDSRLVFNELRRFYRKRHLEKFDSALSRGVMRAP